MNVCLVTSRGSGVPPLARRLDASGYRVVVVFLRRCPRALWTEGSIVCFSLLAGGRTESAFRENFHAARRAIFSQVEKLPFRLSPRLSRWERRLSRVSEEAVARVAGLADALVPVRSENPWDGLPLGLASYGLFQACDTESIDEARHVAQRAGAPFVGPFVSDLDAAYDQALLHWMRN